MTMDIQNYSFKESSPDSKVTNLSMPCANKKNDMQKSSKRSFDVAFLMMPDEKKSKVPDKHLRVSKQLFAGHEWESQAKKVNFVQEPNYEKDCVDSTKYDERVRANNNESPYGVEQNIDVGTDEYSQGKVIYCSDSETSEKSRSRPNSNESAARLKYLPEPYRHKVFDDPTIISMQSKARYEQMRYAEKYSEVSPKSAFTKVTSAANFIRSSPNPSVSPDNLMYQNSISPPLSASSPPIAFTKSSFNHLLSPNHILTANSFFKTNVSMSNYVESAHQIPRGYARNMEYNEKQIEKQTTKANMLPFRPDIPAYLQTGSSYPFAVQNFQQPSAEFIKFPVPSREPVSPLIANPAAAILSTILPPTLAAFSLPAQNVCAKCNISFRMTSDLVYHMRTQHKSESVSDPNRRKREDKLKCPVCAESFRERHHLTRHMTAHQDKEGDGDDGSNNVIINSNKKHFYPQSSGTAASQK